MYVYQLIVVVLYGSPGCIRNVISMHKNYEYKIDNKHEYKYNNNNK